LPQLKVLKLQQVANVTPVLEVLAKSGQIRMLKLSQTDLTARDLDLIGRMKNLDTLELSVQHLPGNFVSAISSLPQLRRLSIDDRTYIADLPNFRVDAAGLKFPSTCQICSTTGWFDPLSNYVCDKNLW